MEYKDSAKQELVDEISLVDIVKVIQKWRKLIIFGTLFCTIIAILIAYFAPKNYKSTAFFQLSKDNRIVELPKFKKYYSLITSEKKFLDYLNNNQKLLEIDFSNLENSLTDSQFLDKKIEVIKAYTEEEVRSSLRTLELKNYILGLNLSAESSTPEEAQRFLYIFGDYIKNSIIYIVLNDYIMKKLSSASNGIKKYENLIIKATFNLEQLSKKNEELLVIYKKYPEARNLESRQLVSIQEGGYRYLAPVTQLIGIESQIVDLRTSVNNYERELLKSKIRFDFFEKSNKYLNEHTSWETIYINLKNLKDSIFSSIESIENNEIAKEVFNELSINFRNFDTVFYEVYTFVKEPTLPVNPAKTNSKIIVGVTFILSFFVLVLFSFFLEWWITHKDEIKS